MGGCSASICFGCVMDYMLRCLHRYLLICYCLWVVGFGFCGLGYVGILLAGLGSLVLLWV